MGTQIWIVQTHHRDYSTLNEHLVAFFSPIYGFHFTILTNFYIYLQYFQ